MIICVCKAVSDKHIQAAVDNGAVTLGQVVSQLGVGTCCGSCVPHVEETIAARTAGRLRAAAPPVQRAGDSV